MQPSDDDQDTPTGLFDAAQVRNYAQFVIGALSRRRWLATTVFSSIVLLTALALLILPRTYHAEAKLFAQRSQVLVVRGDGPDATVAPTRGATETVLRRDNLIAIIQETDLLKHHHEHRAVSQRLLDSAMRIVLPLPTEQDELDAMIERLEKKLGVWTTDGTVGIGIDWSDAAMAARIVDAAQRNFLETRRAQEITALVESIAIVRSHAASLSRDVDDAVAALEKLRESKRPQLAKDESAPRSATVTRSAAVSRPTQASATTTTEDLTALKASIDAQQHSIDALEDVRRRRLSEAQARMVEQRATLTENHPVVVELQKTIAALGSPSPQIATMRHDLAAMQAELAGKRATPKEEPGEPKRVAWTGTVSTTGATAAPPQLPSEIMRLDSELREDRDPMTVYARGQLRDAMEKYSALRAQLQTAQIELETAEAAFKYRYRILTPAQVPRKPIKPNVPLIVVLAVFAAAFSAVVVAAIVELRAGRLVERWQIEEILGVPILAEMEVPRLPERGSS